MFAFFQHLTKIAVPIYVISTMLNVGLTQKPTTIVQYWRDWRFVLKMLLANFILAPLVMIALLNVASFEPALKAGLLLFGVCAGAPFLIKLTQTSGHDLALGAATMLLLMVVTVIYVPIVLPLFLSGISVDAWAIARSLLLQMILPIVLGTIIAKWLRALTRTVQPWIAKLGNYALYVVLAATLIGYFPNMLNIIGTGALFIAIAFVVAAFGIGYGMGSGQDHLEDVGGLATAQRNTAAGLIIATQNFSNPNVLVMLTLANLLGLIALLGVAKLLSRDN